MTEQEGFYDVFRTLLKIINIEFIILEYRLTLMNICNL